MYIDMLYIKYIILYIICKLYSKSNYTIFFVVRGHSFSWSNVFQYGLIFKEPVFFLWKTRYTLFHYEVITEYQILFLLQDSVILLN